jgi:hypothetical protein
MELTMAVSDLIRTIESAPVQIALRAFRRGKRIHLQRELSNEGTAADRRSFETALEDALARRKKFGTHDTREQIKEIEDDVCLSYS